MEMQARRYMKQLQNCMMKKNNLFILIIVAILIFSGCGKEEKVEIIKVDVPKYTVNKGVFFENTVVINDLVERGSIDTNYFFINNKIKTDNRVLSETQGLIMEYAVYIRNKELFEKSFQYLKLNMTLKNGLFSWEYNNKDEKKSNSSATIDDLRVLKSLVYANSLWGEYEADIRQLEKGIRNLEKKGYLTDFLDRSGVSKEVSTHYVDIVAISMLAQMNKRYEEVLKKSIELLRESRIKTENNLPLYYEIYNVKNKSFEKIKEINMLTYLIVIENRKAAGLNIEEDLKFLKVIFQRDGGLYSKYDLLGNPTSKIKSTAIYAYLKKIFLKEKDSDFIKKIDQEIKVLLNGNMLPISQGEGKLYSFDLLILLLSDFEEKE